MSRQEMLQSLKKETEDCQRGHCVYNRFQWGFEGTLGVKQAGGGCGTDRRAVTGEGGAWGHHAMRQRTQYY
jgi:hypothetical protein